MTYEFTLEDVTPRALENLHRIVSQYAILTVQGDTTTIEFPGPLQSKAEYKRQSRQLIVEIIDGPKLIPISMIRKQLQAALTADTDLSPNLPY